MAALPTCPDDPSADPGVTPYANRTQSTLAVDNFVGKLSPPGCKAQIDAGENKLLHDWAGDFPCISTTCTNVTGS
ncbi:hypothetical protein [Caldimonas thermodepolymerans]|uniref:hypothetical protein n=1 Tax=Caldimonas thermodepolymerans TaxID=215580 RepID=UPI002235E052|nr:hypothetical protein [Caldimonas thermodepolymerans]UZG43019.1 hypothetical protein ONZ46_11350 [Caldimonas thermodepolymerans]